MSDDLRIAPNLTLPPEAVTETFAIIAKRGMGKTYLSADMAEEMIEGGHQVCIVDPIGVWWGLRSSADGKSPGLPVIILGGDHADAPLESTAGAVIADFVVDHYASVILDLSLFRKNETTRFMTDFGERLYHRNREPLHLILDEADAFAPQRPMKGQERMLGAMEDLVRRGRARGIGVTLITQRSAVLNKDVLTQVEVLVSLRVTSPQDRKAVDEWIKLHAGDDTQRDEFLSSLPSLPVGEAWWWSPGWLDIFKRCKARKRKTFDSSATPKVGKRRVEPKAFAEIDIEALAGQIADTIEKAKADDPKLLKRRIAELEKELRDRQPDVRVEKVEVPILSEAEVADIVGATETLRYCVDAAQTVADKLTKGIRGHEEANDRGGADLRSGEAPTRRKGARSANLHHSQTSTRPARGGTRDGEAASAVQPTGQGSDDVHLKAGARKIVETLARHYPMSFTKAQVGTMTGFKIKGGTFQTYWSQIKRAGLIEESAGLVTATQAGLDFAGVQPGNPLSTKEMIEMWGSKLKRGAREILNLLVESYPMAWSKEDIGVEVGMEPGGGTFQTYISTLRRNNLIEVEDGKLRASDSLFID